MEKSIKDCIRSRRSVRTFSGSLSDEDKSKIELLLTKTDNPFGVKVEFRFLQASEYKLTSPVIVGADHYVAAKVSREPRWEIAFGYSFEKFCLLVCDIDLGTVMLAATLNRGAFEEALQVGENEVMPVATPIGRIAEKMSLMERIMRKGTKADTRLPFDELFFDKSFDRGLLPEQAGKYQEALEMLRLAPSAVNKQPWRVVMDGETLHFYEKKNSIANHKMGDIQKVDIGIALAHFDLTLREEGREGEFFEQNPKIQTELEYIISYRG
ncbi:MAG: nitroreductase [Clostridia bacterium]|nr:nitroreductase [Clostridia bacterium]